MEQPYFLLSLLFVLAGGIALGIVWCKSYGYLKYHEERKPPDLQQPRDDDALLHEAQMMRDAQKSQYDEAIKFGQEQIKEFQNKKVLNKQGGDSK